MAGTPRKERQRKPKNEGSLFQVGKVLLVLYTSGSHESRTFLSLLKKWRAYVLLIRTWDQMFYFKRMTEGPRQPSDQQDARSKVNSGRKNWNTCLASSENAETLIESQIS
jgi:hypothetical protein